MGVSALEPAFASIWLWELGEAAFLPWIYLLTNNTVLFHSASERIK